MPNEPDNKLPTPVILAREIALDRLNGNLAVGTQVAKDLGCTCRRTNVPHHLQIDLLCPVHTIAIEHPPVKDHEC
ncbi:hypothetical protein [Schlesneria sp. T3-172]|uniref:hypothetical protein n=1 Tax=Schlesneria sphaerica TaxID=3373610 RepID=UPI0037CB73A0